MLRQLLLSPYFNTNTNVFELFNYIIKYRPDYKHKKLEENRVFTQLFPNKYATSNSRAGLMHKLTDLLEKFMAQQGGIRLNLTENKSTQLQQKYYNEIQFNLKILDFYIDELKKFPSNTQLKEELLHQFEGKYASLQRLLVKMPYQNIDYYKCHHALEENYTTYLSYQNVMNYSEQLHKVMYYSSICALIEKLQLACLIINDSVVYKKEVEQHFLRQINQQIEQETGLLSIPVINIYHLALQCLQSLQLKFENEHHHHFERYLSSLLSGDLHLAIEELRPLHEYANNYCLLQLKNGTTRFRAILLDLYQFQKDKGILLRNGQLKANILRNISILALSEKRIKWLASFLEEVKGKIIGGDVFYYFNAALLTFYQQNFEACIDFLLDKEATQQTGNIVVIKFDILAYKINVRRILLKAFYELGFDFDVRTKWGIVEGELSSFERIHNNLSTFLSYHEQEAKARGLYDGNRAFLTLSRRLFIQKEFATDKKVRQIELTKIKESFFYLKETNTIIAEEQWLLEKINQSCANVEV